MSTHLLERLLAVRRRSVDLIAPLQPEDLCLQGMADASPPKWHLGHTTWFFEQFLLLPLMERGLALDHEPAPASWSFLFNSYYEAVGARHPRPQRGLLSRPGIGEVLAWRQRVDRALAQLPPLLEQQPAPHRQASLALLELGLQPDQGGVAHRPHKALGDPPLRPDRCCDAAHALASAWRDRRQAP